MGKFDKKPGKRDSHRSSSRSGDKGGKSRFPSKGPRREADGDKPRFARKRDGGSDFPSKRFDRDKPFEKKKFDRDDRGDSEDKPRRERPSFRRDDAGSAGRSFPRSGERKGAGRKRDDDRPARSRDRDDRGERPSFRKRNDDERASRSRDSEDRPSFRKRDDGDRPARSGARGERSSLRKRDDSERPARSRDSEDRPSFRKRDGDERPPRGRDRDERPSFRKRNDDERSTGEGEDKPRARRSFSGDSESGEKRGRGFRRDDDRPRRSDDGERRSFRSRDTDDESPRRRSRDNDSDTDPAGRSERPKRSFKREDRPFRERGEKKPFRAKRAELPKQPAKESDPDLIRLNKYLSNAGIASRREADTLIESGAVKVNGEVITQLGYKIRRGDKVTYGDESVKSERKVYLLLNKPKDYLTTTDDPRERKTVMHLIEDACNERIYPVGRLDRNTTGVLLFTNDGDLAKKLTHPKHQVRKVYHVTLNKGLRADDFKKIIDGVELEDGIITADDLSFVGEGKKEVGIEIHSGRNRIVRRLFEHLGYEVIKLDRVVFAGLTKKELARGRHRFLTPKEVSFLKMIG